MQKLQQKLNYQFTNISLLKQALTHRSKGKDNNERFEFLGDSVLGVVISAELFRRFSSIDEGKLSRLRSHLVREQTLLQIAEHLNLAALIIVGAGERKSGNFKRGAMLADTLEAIFAAVFLDSDFATARSVILSLYQPRLAGINLDDSLKDFKTQLQEYLQKHNNSLPKYTLIATSGSDHNALFSVNCVVNEPKIQAHSEANSIKKAEQKCAQILLVKLNLL